MLLGNKVTSNKKNATEKSLSLNSSPYHFQQIDQYKLY